ncbi:T6SS phospholipase effector Tle1-like catalytic domain-containing protein, partial [Photorhabdus luminescens]|uniref:T6SS phospholipase effector Tle1-like catalytic domain-containing protein n=1 Tax=Photorhabdus luminescens TaxID=29488 RepID=UPI003F741279
MCFPMDSIRRSDGTYPTGSTEVIYPGVHSDLGGGYPPGEQGKAIGETDGLLLSQIALHEMYAAAFKAGAPLKVPQSALPNDLQDQLWRAMNADIQREFDIDTQLVNRFNAWRQVTLGLDMPKQPLSDEEAARFEPVRASVALEQAMKNQMNWLTAWRINRYANGTLLGAPFFHEAPNRDAKKAHYEQSEKAQKAAQQQVEAKRKAQWNEFLRDGGKTPPLLMQGVPDFDPETAQNQLREAAAEFNSDYHGDQREQHSRWQFAVDTVPRYAIYMLDDHDDLLEYLQMKAGGEALVKQLFRPAPAVKPGQQESPESLLVALYDNQVHDSRAWFMYSTLGSREPLGGYFRYRVIYFGTVCSRPLSLLSVAGTVVGFVFPSSSRVLFLFKQKKVANTMVDAIDKVSRSIAAEREVTAQYLTSGELITLLAGPEYRKAFTHNVGEVTRQQREFLKERRLQMTQD